MIPAFHVRCFLSCLETTPYRRPNRALRIRFPALHELAGDVLRHARQLGASDCEVDVSEGFGQGVTVRCGAVETIEYNRDKELASPFILDSARGVRVPPIFPRQLCTKRLRQPSILPVSRPKILVLVCLNPACWRLLMTAPLISICIIRGASASMSRLKVGSSLRAGRLFGQSP